MSATFAFSESNGVGELVTDSITNVNFGNNDSANLTTTSYPIVAGNNSYEKYLRVKFGGVFAQISNVKFWKSAGFYKTGEQIMAAANQAYVQPVNTTSAVAISLIPDVIGSALAIQSTEGGPTLFTVAGYSKYLTLQTQTTSSTPAGAVNTKTFTVQYDEI